MSSSLKKIYAILLLVAIHLISSTHPVQAGNKINLFYPNQDEPEFILQAPADWEIKAANDDNPYATISGPTGVVFSFRTLEGGSKEKFTDNLMKAIEESAEFLKEHYEDVVLEEPKEETHNGLPGFYAAGMGKDPKNTNKTVFIMGWYVLPSGNIAEIWFAVDENDKEGVSQADDIMSTFRAP